MVLFTNEQLEIYKRWLLNKKNKEVARELSVSEAYVSQTLKKINEKIRNLKDSLPLLEKIGVVDSITPLKLTEEGRSAVQKRISERQGQTTEREGIMIEEKAVEHFLSSHAQNIPGIMQKWKTYVQSEDLKEHGFTFFSDLTNQDLEQQIFSDERTKLQSDKYLELALEGGLANDAIESIPLYAKSSPRHERDR